MKINAKEMNKVIIRLGTAIARSIALATLDELKPIHEIGCVNIYKTQKGLFVSVNKESLKSIYFDSENDALDFYLDQYESTKEFKQQNLFNP